MTVAPFVFEGEVLPPLEDEEITESDRIDNFMLSHAQNCGDYWCARGIAPCIVVVPNTEP